MGSPIPAVQSGMIRLPADALCIWKYVIRLPTNALYTETVQSAGLQMHYIVYRWNWVIRLPAGALYTCNYVIRLPT